VSGVETNWGRGTGAPQVELLTRGSTGSDGEGAQQKQPKEAAKWQSADGRPTIASS